MRGRASDRWVQPFLDALRDGGVVRYAAQEAHVNRATVYALVQADPEFAKAFDDAREEAIQAMEREARRRALEGIDEPVYQGGKLVGRVRKYSDVLLMFLLKASRPAVYRDNVRIEASGPNGGPIQHEVRSALDSMADHERIALRRAIDEAVERARQAQGAPAA